MWIYTGLHLQQLGYLQLTVYSNFFIMFVNEKHMPDILSLSVLKYLNQPQNIYLLFIVCICKKTRKSIKHNIHTVKPHVQTNSYKDSFVKNTNKNCGHITYNLDSESFSSIRELLYPLEIENYSNKRYLL